MDKVIICEAIEAKGIAAALADFIAEMETAYLVQGHAKEEAIFIEINSAEGFLMVGWDRKGGGDPLFAEDHWPVHYLELKHLWRKAMDHPEGQRHFDQQAHLAICSVVEVMAIAAEKSGRSEAYEVYELFEGSTNGSQRVLV
jgi:hypothetical protein